MKQRLITSAIIFAVMLAVMLLSWTYVFPVVLSVLSVVAIFEVLRVFNVHKRLFISGASYIVAAALPIVAYLMRDLGYKAVDYILVMSLTLFCLMLYLFIVSVFERGAVPFSEISGAFMITAYVVSAFSALSVVRQIDKVGFYCLGLVIIVSWITDSCAYIVGSLIGKHKLIPEISPKKTVEGAIGGVICAGIATMLYGWIISLVSTDVKADYLVLAISGVVLSIISQIGDLLASVIKREHNVKDYGAILPGHGGIMDRFDSILAVSTATMIISLVFKPFT